MPRSDRSDRGKNRRRSRRRVPTARTADPAGPPNKRPPYCWLNMAIGLIRWPSRPYPSMRSSKSTFNSRSRCRIFSSCLSWGTFMGQPGSMKAGLQSTRASTRTTTHGSSANRVGEWPRTSPGSASASRTPDSANISRRPGQRAANGVNLRTMRVRRLAVLLRAIVAGQGGADTRDGNRPFPVCLRTTCLGT